MTPEYVRFQSKVSRQPTDEGCLEWEAAVNADGYGRFGAGGFDWKAHRWIFQHVHGFLPEVVMHTCDNPPCVNLNHLRAGTHKENNRDKCEKGRARGARRGELHHLAKLSNEDCEEIRIEYAKGVLTQDALAEVYGVDRSAISLITTKKRRKASSQK